MSTLYLLTIEYIDTPLATTIIDASDMGTAQRLAKEDASEDMKMFARGDLGHEKLDQANLDKLLWTEDSIEGWELSDPDDILGSYGWKIHLRVPEIIRAT